MMRIKQNVRGVAGNAHPTWQAAAPVASLLA